MVRKKIFNRYCDVCGKTYYRCNKTRVWTERNPGHRAGWKAEEKKICMDCGSAATMKRVISIVSIKPVQPKGKFAYG